MNFKNVKYSKSLSDLLLFCFVYFQLFGFLLNAGEYEIRNERILAPEVTHFVGRGEPAVDSRGDLGVSIPLMTVPGRDGLDFEIIARYRSGIQVTQSASWIGLGWSLDVGSITRHALGAIQGHSQTDWARAFGGQTGDIISQPDVYVVNMNGNSTILLSNTYETDRQIPFDPAATNEAGPTFINQFGMQWYLVSSPWKPWKFSFDLDDSVVVDGESTIREDVKKIMIITEDGTRYVYSLPSLSEPSFPPDDLGTQIYKYVSTWRLTAILSPDYPYDLYAEEPNETSPGGWVKISYRTWDEFILPGNENEENYKIIDTISRDNPRLFAQLTFPYKIETPTHYAQFITSKRYDRDLAYLENPTDLPVTTENYFHRKLDKIVLYKKALDGEGDEKILQVTFTYMENGAPTIITDFNDPRIKKMLSKLALQEIKITGFQGASQQSLPGYKFSYNEGDKSWYDITRFSEPIYRYYTDDFGYYDRDPLFSGSVPDTDGPMWSLTKIVYPEGGCHVITYESDSLFSINFNYDYFNHYLEPNPNVLEHRSGYFKRNKQGGARVKYIDSYNNGYAGGDYDRVEFNYGPGHHSGIPDIWFRKLSEFSSSPMYFSGERGQFNVTYEYVTRKFEDGSSIKTYYEIGNPEQQLFYRYSNNQLANLHGNKTWNWGEVTKSEYHAANGSTVKEEILNWTYRGNYGDQSLIHVAVVAPAFPLSGGGATTPIYLDFAHKQLNSKITKNYYGSNIISLTEEFQYNDGTMLEKKKELADNGVIRQTATNYAHDVLSASPYSDMRYRNMRTQTAQTSVLNENDLGYNSTITTWKSVDHSGNIKYIAAKKFKWLNEASASVPAFNWSSPTEGNGWFQSLEFVEYDQHGNLKKVTDANGGETTIDWEGNGCLIDKITSNPGLAIPLITDYNYDPNTFHLTSRTEPDGKTTYYEYDPLQRLTNIKNSAIDVVSTYAYYYSRDGHQGDYDPTDPNSISTTSYFSNTLQGLSTNYFDGLARLIQNQIDEGSDLIVTETVYDPMNRDVVVTKPARYIGTSTGFKPGFIESGWTIGNAMNSSSYLNDYYDSDPIEPYAPNGGGYPYNYTTYYADPLNRVYQIGQPGNDFRIGSGHEMEYSYATNTSAISVGSISYPANSLYETVTLDENDKTTKEYKDKLGALVYRVVDPSGLNLRTGFHYDIFGSLTKIIPPNAANNENSSYCTAMKYNTLSHLRKKVSPDADGDGNGDPSNETIDGATVDYEYLYDKNGNLRFLLDPKGRNDVTPYFIYNKYDVFNRMTEAGIMTNPGGNFTAANAQNPQYPTNGHDIKLAYCYDSEPSYGSDVWRYSTDPGTLNNLQGRLSAVAYFEQAISKWGYTFYSYDSDGNIEWIIQDLPGKDMDVKKVAYEYDRQKNVTKISYQQSQSDAFFIWQDYDQVGRLTAIYASETNNKPAASVATFAYWPTGLMKRKVLGNNIQGMDYVYTIRDWLTQLNHQNINENPGSPGYGDPGGDGPGGSSNVEIYDRFGGIIGYQAAGHIASDTDFSFQPQYNGNISWLIQSSHGFDPMLSGFTYQYDHVNRLKQSDYGYYASGWHQQPNNGYDVRDLAYDANGNFTVLKRYDRNGVLSNLAYRYFDNSNRLKNIDGTTNVNYNYDANGNLIQDLRKNLTSSYYDYRNLAYQINFNNGAWLKFGYDGSGNRIYKKVKIAE